MYTMLGSSSKVAARMSLVRLAMYDAPIELVQTSIVPVAREMSTE